MNFGGSAPSAIIGAHAFYADRAPRPGRPAAFAHFVRSPIGAGSAGEIFVGENRADSLSRAPAEVRRDAASGWGQDGREGIFVP
jgi:hypothetical protein